MKLDMTPELYKLVDEALKDSRYSDSDREEYDGHKWAHRVSELLSDELVDQHMPSPSDIRESIAGAMVAKVISASKRRPRLTNTLLRYCEMKEVIPEELVELPGKKLVPRSQLYAHEQDFLAAKHKADATALAEKAKYESLLAEPFIKWRDEQLSKGRPASHLTQMTFWIECGHVAELAAAAE